MTSSGEVLNVGTHSAASKTPNRPLVPAPMYINRPCFLNLDIASLMTFVNSGMIGSIALATN